MHTGQLLLGLSSSTVPVLDLSDDESRSTQVAPGDI